MADREQQVSLTPSQLAKAKDAIDLLSSLTSPGTTTQNRVGECSRESARPSDAGPSRTSDLKRADEGTLISVLISFLEQARQGQLILISCFLDAIFSMSRN
jgi:hypothetical protein